MRFMIIRKADSKTEAGVLPSEELMRAMMAYNEELARAGVLLGGLGLQPSSKGVRVTFRDGKASVTDGPFTEAKELIAGFTLIEVASKEEAIEWVKRWPTLDVGDEDGLQIEIRQLFEPTELTQDPQILQQMSEVQAENSPLRKP